MKKPSQHQRSIKMQRMAVGGNAAFSALCGAACLLARNAIGDLVGVSPAALAGLGIELLAFAGFLGFLATRKDLTRSWIQTSVLIIGILDAAWVVGSAVALFQPTPLTTAGRWVVAVVALPVAEFAAFQLLGWWRLRRTTAAHDRHHDEPTGATLHRNPARTELSA